MRLNEMHQNCPECGGPAFTDLLLAEKKDACYYKVKASAKVWPSAYASGRLVQCRKKGAKNYGNKSESVTEMDKSQKGAPGWNIGNDDPGGKEYYGKAAKAKDVAKKAGKALDKAFDKAHSKKKVDEDQLDEKCWDTHKQVGMKNKGGRQVPNCVPKEGVEEAANPAQQAAIAISMKKAGKKPMNEYNAEYDDEAGMAHGSLHTLKNAVEGLMTVIDDGDNLPEWCQEKISLAEDYLVTVWDYLQSEKAQGVDPEVEAMYEAMEDLVTEMSQKYRIHEDLVWESFEAMPDNVLYETAAWRRKEGKSKTGGLNKKGVASYRREHPGSKLQTAVTTKPSKLKPGSKAAKRRKSFCARMSGVKGPMKKPNGKPTRKALALRKWNC